MPGTPLGERVKHGTHSAAYGKAGGLIRTGRPLGAPPWCPGTLCNVRANNLPQPSTEATAACRNHPMQLWFALASLASVSALNAGVRVQPHLPTTKIGRVVPARCVLAEAEEPGGLKQFAIDAGITTMRLGTCALMIHHGFDKVQVTLTGA